MVLGNKALRAVSFFLIVLITVNTFFILDTSGSEPVLERYVFEGTVSHNRTLNGLYNFTVRVDKEGFKALEDRTDINGSYSFILPPGEYHVDVFSPAGIQVGHNETVIGPSMTNYYDFEIDPLNLDRAVLYGRIVNDLGDGVEDATISLVQYDPDWINSTMTDESGRFSILVPPGKYRMRVTYNDKERINQTVDLSWAEKREMNLEMDLSNERPFIQEVFDFLTNNWQNILFLVGILALILLFYGLYIGISNSIKKKNKKLFENEWFSPVRRFVGRLGTLAIIMIIVRQVAQFSPPVKDYLWEWLPRVGAAVGGSLFMILVMRLLLSGDNQFWEYVRKKKGKKSNIILPQQLISLLEMITRYLIFFIGGAIILILILSAFGLSDEIAGMSRDFFSANAGRLLFLVALVIAGILVKKLIDIFYQELSTRSTKLSPQVMEMSKKGATGLIFFVIALIFMFTLLSIGGLGDIGQTFVLVISMIVGLVVSFAATGSIGNLLSGLVLITMKPYEVGDRVEIQNGLIGTVAIMGMMFTRIRDLEGRMIDVPNNNILMTNITNFSRSAEDGGYAVYIDVTLGYEIPPKRIRALLKRAAITSPGVLRDPSPVVLIRQFHNHAVEYRLRAYIEDPQNMMFIRSSVMESMLMIFHQEGLEILSPLYHVKREAKIPTSEELMDRVNSTSQPSKEDVSGLSMFDSINELEEGSKTNCEQPQ